ncbi:hypothetical protein ACG98H_00405 [Corynebacterium sp. L4756]|uniref:hypothetical protein n=1 Tax=unclassified Corynebacterium TaxID=2624378 RepID=UPI00374DA6F3
MTISISDAARACGEARQALAPELGNIFVVVERDKKRRMKIRGDGIFYSLFI